MPDSAKEIGRKTDDSDLFDTAVRIGLISYGVVHLLIGWLAASLAFGRSEGSASKDGALNHIAAQPLGSVVLYVMAAGFLALVVWQLIEAVAGHRDKDGVERKRKQMSSVIKMGIYGFFGFSSLKVATSGRSGGDRTEPMTAKVMALPTGQLLVGLIGIGVAIYACSLIYRGLSEGFKEHLTAQGRTGELGRAYVVLGKVGYVSKGLA